MIKIVNGKLKAPSSIQVDNVTLRRVLGGQVHQMYKDLVGDKPGNRIADSVVYEIKNCKVIVSADESQHGLLLHASISHNDRDPAWETIKSMKAAVFGDTDVMMVLPKSENFVNLHTHTFHLWQMPVEWGLA